jgi:hypothetical protein
LRIDQSTIYVGDGTVFKHNSCFNSSFGGGAIRTLGAATLNAGSNLVFYNCSAPNGSVKEMDFGWIRTQPLVNISAKTLLNCLSSYLPTLSLQRGDLRAQQLDRDDRKVRGSWMVEPIVGMYAVNSSTITYTYIRSCSGANFSFNVGGYEGGAFHLRGGSMSLGR